MTGIDVIDPVWHRIREEAQAVARQGPELATCICSAILHHDMLEEAVVQRIAERLDHPELAAGLIRQACADAIAEEAALCGAFVPTPLQHTGTDNRPAVGDGAGRTIGGAGDALKSGFWSAIRCGYSRSRVNQRVRQRRFRSQ